MTKRSKAKLDNHLRNARFQFWRYAEGRAVLEWQSFYLLKPLLKRLPKGDGHAVIVFPGFLATDTSTAPMRKLLSDLGYQVHGWGQGRNLMIDQDQERRLLALLARVFEQSGGKVSLVGWSLGGLYARELAKAQPDQVRCVISMGSPISGKREDSNASALFEHLNGRQVNAKSGQRPNLNVPPPVPTTSIYSKSDGIVHWRGSVQQEHAFPVHQENENIELPASHLGLGVNALAMVAVADRLAQQEGRWVKFDTSGWRALLFRRPRQRLLDRLKAAVG